MIDLETIRDLIKPRMKRILDFGELALPPGQFTAFRKLVLDEFGRSGLESELERASREQRKSGLEWAGQHSKERR